jgi:ligand-binding sensor domain-containing protein
MKTIKLFLLSSVLSLFPLTAMAQTGNIWEHYEFSGAPQCMIADGSYLWIGNDQGLVRYDRAVDTFANYYASIPGLPERWVTALTRAKDGSIWIGTRFGGLVQFANNIWTTYSTMNSPLPTDNITALAADSLGRVWVGTSSGLCAYDGGTWTLYTTPQAPFTNNAIYGLAADKLGNVWIATGNTQLPAHASILKFDGGTNWELHNSATDINFDASSNVASMMIAKNGDLWLGMEGYLDHVQGKTWTSTLAQPAHNGPTKNNVTALSEDTAGVIWSANSYGAGRYDGATWQALESKDGSFPFPRCHGVIAESGKFWFASYNDVTVGPYGFAKYDQGKWTLHDSLSNCTLDNPTIYAMTIDSRGRFWCGERYTNRVSMFDGFTWTKFDDVTRNTYTMSMCADSSGNVYIGTGFQGIVKFDGVTPQYFDYTNTTLHSCVISALAWDERRKTLWVGEQFDSKSVIKYPAGLAKFDGTSWSNYTVVDSPLPGMEQSSLAVDDSGVWTSTWYSGVAHFDGVSKWNVFSTTNSAIPGDRVWKVQQALNGDIWIATEFGAAKWDGAKWIPFTTANSGIIANLATCGSDQLGNIWFGAFNGYGSGGACTFDGTKWTTYTPLNSGIGSNLLENIVGGINGDVWIATYDQGVVRYNPNGIKPPCLNQVARLSIDQASSATQGALRAVVTLKDSVPQYLGLKEVTLTIKYDARMLSIKNVTPQSGWSVTGSTNIATGLQITLNCQPHFAKAGEALLVCDLEAFVGVVTSSGVSLIDTRFNPSDAKYESCTLASIPTDSMLVSLENACGDSTIRASMDHTPLLQLLSANPDPVLRGGQNFSLTLKSAFEQEATVTITNLVGVVVRSKQLTLTRGKGSYDVDLAGLASGAYLIEVSGGGSGVSRKIVVQ